MDSIEFDLIIIGAGVTGLSTALVALKSGVESVVCIDQYGIANPIGASGDGLRLFRLSYFEHPAYVPLLRKAIDRWQALGDSFYFPVGGFYAGPLKSELVQGSLESATRHKIPHDIMPAETARKQFPQFNLPSDYVAFIEPEGGYIRAEAGTIAIGQAARALGLEMIEAKVQGITSRGEQWTVECGDFSINAEQVIVAAGYQTGSLVPKLKPFLKREDHLLLWLKDSNHTYDQGPGFGIMNELGEMLYGFPAVDDVPGVKIGGHHQFSSGSIDEQSERLRVLSSTYLPQLTGPVDSLKICPYDMSPDGHFMFGEVEPGLSVACGLSGHGFKFGPVLGELAYAAANEGLAEELAFLSVNRYVI
jgi:sarcosine oxidase